MKQEHRSSLPWLTLLLLLSFLALGGCAHQPASESDGVPGFFSGLLHGVLIVFSLVGSIFFDIRIYAFPNSGFFYDLGYLIGVMFLYAGGRKGASRS